jgi:hypothetical protein
MVLRKNPIEEMGYKKQQQHDRSITLDIDCQMGRAQWAVLSQHEKNTTLTQHGPLGIVSCRPDPIHSVVSTPQPQHVVSVRTQHDLRLGTIGPM